MTSVSRAKSRSAAAIALTAIAAAALLAYANTARVPLLFDDVGAIAQNPSIRHLATALDPPSGLSVSGRPLANLSLAADFAVSGQSVWSYHLTNLALHILGAVLLFGIVRDAMARARRDRSWIVPFAAALLWALHPIQTSAVTYLMQRTELLAADCLLLACYAFARADRSRDPRAWLGVSVTACWLGMAGKEIMVVAPVAVLLYDVAFHAGGFRTALRKRWPYYAALFASLLLLGALVVLERGRAGSAGFHAGMSVGDYLGTQAYALVRYMRLILWPVGLVFDYGTRPVRDPFVIVPAAALIGVVGLGATWLTRRHPRIAFALAWPLLVLAPSSSFVPIATQTIAEHRVYLALAAPIALVVATAARLIGARVVPGAIVAALALGGLTFLRNADYRTERSIWRDTVEKRPENGRAWYNLGLAEIDAGDRKAAVEALTRAVAFDPTNIGAEAHLGELLAESGRPGEALRHLEIAAALQPSAITCANLGNAYLAVNRLGDALVQYDGAAKRDPRSANIQLGRGNALVRLGRISEAESAFGEAVRLAPNSAAAHYNHGAALAQTGRYDQALAEFEAAAKLDPSDPAARANAARIREYLRQ